MYRIYLSLALMCAVSCTKNHSIDSAEAPFTIRVETETTRGSIVNKPKDMGSMGVYCAHTGQVGWSTSANFDKLFNSRCTIDETGYGSIDGDKVPWGYTLPSDNYTFFAYSPHSSDARGITPSIENGELKLKFRARSGSEQQPDLMVATPRKDIVAQIANGVALHFTHVLSCVSFGVVSNTSTKITAVELSGVANSATLTWNGECYEWGSFRSSVHPFTVEIDTNYAIDAETPSQLNTESGYLMMLPQTLSSGATVKLYLDDNTTRELTIPANTKWLAGERYHYNIELSDEEEDSGFIFDSKQISNCYIIHPIEGERTIVQIPIEDRINDFWEHYSEIRNKKITNMSSHKDFKVVTIWEDFDGEVSYDADVFKDTNDNFKLAVSLDFGAEYQEGNFVFAVKQKSNNQILWSWHLWFTDYDPDAIAKANRNKIATDEDGVFTYKDYEGAVHHYTDSNGSTTWSKYYSDKFTMDRNIGEHSRSCTSSSSSGALYYQHGRKDPFPDVDSYYNRDVCLVLRHSQTGVSFQESVENPYQFYYSNTSDANWCGDAIAQETFYIWSDLRFKIANMQSGKTGKSIFDPSPLGWCLPINGAWSSFDGASNCSLAQLSSYEYFGYIDSSNNASLTDVGSVAYAWDANIINNNKGYCLRLSNSSMESDDRKYVSDGLPVRAIEE